MTAMNCPPGTLRVTYRPETRRVTVRLSLRLLLERLGDRRAALLAALVASGERTLLRRPLDQATFNEMKWTH